MKSSRDNFKEEICISSILYNFSPEINSKSIILNQSESEIVKEEMKNVKKIKSHIEDSLNGMKLTSNKFKTINENLKSEIQKATINYRNLKVYLFDFLNKGHNKNEESINRNQTNAGKVENIIISSSSSLEANFNSIKEKLSQNEKEIKKTVDFLKEVQDLSGELINFNLKLIEKTLSSLIKNELNLNVENKTSSIDAKYNEIYKKRVKELQNSNDRLLLDYQNLQEKSKLSGSFRKLCGHYTQEISKSNQKSYKPSLLSNLEIKSLSSSKKLNKHELNIRSANAEMFSTFTSFPKKPNHSLKELSQNLESETLNSKTQIPEKISENLKEVLKKVIGNFNTTLEQLYYQITNKDNNTAASMENNQYVLLCKIIEDAKKELNMESTNYFNLCSNFSGIDVSSLKMKTVEKSSDKINCRKDKSKKTSSCKPKKDNNDVFAQNKIHNTNSNPPLQIRNEKISHQVFKDDESKKATFRKTGQNFNLKDTKIHTLNDQLNAKNKLQICNELIQSNNISTSNQIKNYKSEEMNKFSKILNENEQMKTIILQKNSEIGSLKNAFSNRVNQHIKICEKLIKNQINIINSKIREKFTTISLNLHNNEEKIKRMLHFLKRIINERKKGKMISNNFSNIVEEHNKKKQNYIMKQEKVMLNQIITNAINADKEEPLLNKVHEKIFSDKQKALLSSRNINSSVQTKSKISKINSIKSIKIKPSDTNQQFIDNLKSEVKKKAYDLDNLQQQIISFQNSEASKIDQIKDILGLLDEKESRLKELIEEKSKITQECQDKERIWLEEKKKIQKDYSEINKNRLLLINQNKKLKSELHFFKFELEKNTQHEVILRKDKKLVIQSIHLIEIKFPQIENEKHILNQIKINNKSRITLNLDINKYKPSRENNEIIHQDLKLRNELKEEEFYIHDEVKLNSKKNKDIQIGENIDNNHNTLKLISPALKRNNFINSIENVNDLNLNNSSEFKKGEVNIQLIKVDDLIIICNKYFEELINDSRNTRNEQNIIDLTKQKIDEISDQHNAQLKSNIINFISYLCNICNILYSVLELKNFISLIIEENLVHYSIEDSFQERELTNKQNFPRLENIESISKFYEAFQFSISFILSAKNKIFLFEKELTGLRTNQNIEKKKSEEATEKMIKEMKQLEQNKIDIELTHKTIIDTLNNKVKVKEALIVDKNNIINKKDVDIEKIKHQLNEFRENDAKRKIDLKQFKNIIQSKEQEIMILNKKILSVNENFKKKNEKVNKFKFKINSLNIINSSPINQEMLQEELNQTLILTENLKKHQIELEEKVEQISLTNSSMEKTNENLKFQIEETKSEYESRIKSLKENESNLKEEITKKKNLISCIQIEKDSIIEMHRKLKEEYQIKNVENENLIELNKSELNSFIKRECEMKNQIDQLILSKSELLNENHKIKLEKKSLKEEIQNIKSLDLTKRKYPNLSIQTILIEIIQSKDKNRGNEIIYRKDGKDRKDNLRLKFSHIQYIDIFQNQNIIKKLPRLHFENSNEDNQKENINLEDLLKKESERSSLYFLELSKYRDEFRQLFSFKLPKDLNEKGALSNPLRFKTESQETTEVVSNFFKKEEEFKLKISELTKYNVSLEERIKKIEQERDLTFEENHKLTDANLSYIKIYQEYSRIDEKEKNILDNKNKELENKISNLNEQIEYLKNLNWHKNSMKLKEEKNIQINKNSINVLENTKEKKSFHITHSSEISINEGEKDFHYSKSKLRELNEKVSEKDDLINHLKDQINILGNEIKNLTQIGEKSKLLNDQKSSEISTLKNSIQNLVKDSIENTKSTNKELKSKEERIKKIEQERDLTFEENHKLTDANLSYIKIYQEYSRIDEKEKNILDNKNKELENKISNLNEQIEYLKNLNWHKNSMKLKEEKNIQINKNSINVLENTKEKKSFHITHSSEISINEGEKDFHYSKSKLRELNEKVSEKDDLINHLKDQINILGNEIKNLTQIGEKSKLLNDQKSSEISTLKNSIQNLVKDSIENTKSTNKELKSKEEEFNRILANKVQEINNFFEAKIKNLEDELNYKSIKEDNLMNELARAEKLISHSTLKLDNSNKKFYDDINLLKNNIRIENPTQINQTNSQSSEIDSIGRSNSGNSNSERETILISPLKWKLWTNSSFQNEDGIIEKGQVYNFDIKNDDDIQNELKIKNIIIIFDNIINNLKLKIANINNLNEQYKNKNIELQNYIMQICQGNLSEDDKINLNRKNLSLSKNKLMIFFTESENIFPGIQSMQNYGYFDQVISKLKNYNKMNQMILASPELIGQNLQKQEFEFPLKFKISNQSNIIQYKNLELKKEKTKLISHCKSEENTSTIENSLIISKLEKILKFLNKDIKLIPEIEDISSLLNEIESQIQVKFTLNPNISKSLEFFSFSQISIFFYNRSLEFSRYSRTPVGKSMNTKLQFSDDRQLILEEFKKLELNSTQNQNEIINNLKQAIEEINNRNENFVEKITKENIKLRNDLENSGKIQQELEKNINEMKMEINLYEEENNKLKDINLSINPMVLSKYKEENENENKSTNNINCNSTIISHQIPLNWNNMDYNNLKVHRRIEHKNLSWYLLEYYAIYYWVEQKSIPDDKLTNILQKYLNDSQTHQLENNDTITSINGISSDEYSIYFKDQSKENIIKEFKKILVEKEQIIEDNRSAIFKLKEQNTKLELQLIMERGNNTNNKSKENLGHSNPNNHEKLDCKISHSKEDKNEFLPSKSIDENKNKSLINIKEESYYSEILKDNQIYKDRLQEMILNTNLYEKQLTLLKTELKKCEAALNANLIFKNESEISERFKKAFANCIKLIPIGNTSIDNLILLMLSILNFTQNEINSLFEMRKKQEKEPNRKGKFLGLF